MGYIMEKSLVRELCALETAISSQAQFFLRGGESVAGVYVLELGRHPKIHVEPRSGCNGHSVSVNLGVAVEVQDFTREEHFERLAPMGVSDDKDILRH